VGRLEQRHLVADVGTRGDPQAADLGGGGVGHVVAVEVGGRHDVVLVRTGEQLLEHGVGDAVLDQDLAGRHLAAALVPDLVLGDRDVAELVFGELVAPHPEGALRVLHDVALVHQGDAIALLVDRVADRLAHQLLGAGDRHRLDADAAVGPDRDAHLRNQEVDHLLALGRALGPLDAGVDVLGVLAEDDDVELLGAFYRRRRPLVVLDRAHAGVQVETLAHGDVQRANAAAHRRGERSLDGDLVVGDRVERHLRQVLAELGVGLLPHRDLHPGDLAPAAVGVGDRAVEDRVGRDPQVGADPVAFDVGDDRVVGDDQLAVLDGDLGALGGRGDAR
jgi:hypothetical protein